MKFKIEGVQYEFDEEKMTFAEGRALEKVTGYAFGEIGDHGNELTVIQSFVWIALKRGEPTLKFSDLDDRPFSDFDFDEDDEDADEASPTSGDAASVTDVPSMSNGSSASETSPELVASVLGSSTT